MTVMKWDPKDPGDTADYWVDWGSTAITDPTKRFLPSSVNIAASQFTVPAGLTKVEDDFTTKVQRVRLAGGTDGKYDITSLVTVNTGETFTITITLTVKERTK